MNILERIRKRAKRKNIEYNLDLYWLRHEFKKGRCAATGTPFKTRPKNTRINPFYPSIDRIDSSKGYTIDNCQLVVVAFNNLKSNYDDKTLKEFCEGFVKFYEENVE